MTINWLQNVILKKNLTKIITIGSRRNIYVEYNKTLNELFNEVILLSNQNSLLHIKVSCDDPTRSFK